MKTQVVGIGAGGGQAAPANPAPAHQDDDRDRGLLPLLLLLGAAILGSFSLTAPACQSLFLGAWGAGWLPQAWLATMAGSMAVVAGLRGLARRLDPGQLLALAAWASALILLALGAWERGGQPAATFALFVWRDVTIVVLVELFWTAVNLSPLAKRSADRYGWLAAAGTLGAVAMGAVAAQLAPRFGTRAVLGTAVPLLAGVGVLALPLRRYLAGSSAPPPPTAGGGRPEGRLPRGHDRDLWAILGIILCAHTSLALLDYRVDSALEAHVPDADRRTELLAWLHTATQAVTLVAQASVGRTLACVGRIGALVALPAALTAGLTGSFLAAGPWPLVGTKLVAKACDYSLFRAAKEMLYLPLNYRQKTEGKAWVDVAGSRLAKGLGALAVLVCLRYRWSALPMWTMQAVLLVGWLWLSVVADRRHYRPRGGESPGPS